MLLRREICAIRRNRWNACIVRLWLRHFCQRITASPRVFRFMRIGRYRRRLARRLVFAATVPISLAVAGIGIALTLYPRVADQSPLLEILHLDECSRAIQVFDVNGWIGTFPASLYPRPSCSESTNSESTNSGGSLTRLLMLRIRPTDGGRLIGKQRIRG